MFLMLCKCGYYKSNVKQYVGYAVLKRVKHDWRFSSLRGLPQQSVSNAANRLLRLSKTASLQ